MAEIKIEQKKQVWIWLIPGLVIVALLLYFLVFDDNDKNTEAVTDADHVTNTNDPDYTEENENSGAVWAYIHFVENTDEKMGLDHAYTNEALLKLHEATKAKADEVGYDAQVDLDEVKKYANTISKDPFETTHADNLKKATGLLATVLQNIQKAKYPDLAGEAEDVKSASASIKPGVLTLDQKDAVKNYFAEASELLQDMN